MDELHIAIQKTLPAIDSAIEELTQQKDGFFLPRFELSRFVIASSDASLRIKHQAFYYLTTMSSPKSELRLKDRTKFWEMSSQIENTIKARLDEISKAASYEGSSAKD